ncbi:hypothetical protein ACWECR_38570 [Streptomyces sp. NPDC005056]
MTPTLDTAVAFHQAVLDDHEALTATIARIHEQTSDSTDAYYADIAYFMADLPLHADHPLPRWLDGEPPPARGGGLWSPHDAICCAPSGNPPGETAVQRGRHGLGAHREWARHFAPSARHDADDVCHLWRNSTSKGANAVSTHSS